MRVKGCRGSDSAMFQRDKPPSYPPLIPRNAKFPLKMNNKFQQFNKTSHTALVEIFRPKDCPIHSPPTRDWQHHCLLPPSPGPTRRCWDQKYGSALPWCVYVCVCVYVCMCVCVCGLVGVCVCVCGWVGVGVGVG